MEFFETLTHRHSYRGGFLDQPVPREDLCKIVEAGLLAPSGKNLQTTSFVIVDAEPLVREINGMHQFSKAMRQAKAYIVCVIDRDTSENNIFAIEDCAAATENMLLAITALGYASVWVDGWLRSEGRAEKIGNLLRLPANKQPRVILPIGIPEKSAIFGPEKKPFTERVSFNQTEN
jgi:nitroreductase